MSHCNRNSASPAKINQQNRFGFAPGQSSQDQGHLMAGMWGTVVMQKLWVATMAAVVAVSLSPVRAADLPKKAPAGEAPAASLWSGCYIGVEGGGLWGSSEHVSAAAASSGLSITPKFSESGGSAGGTIGCN
jgi:hypothetical protein